VNKAPLSSRTNRALGGKAPSSYLATLEKRYGHSVDRLDEILRTHQLEPGFLRSDAFHEFILDRATRLLNLIEDAMGKEVSGRDSNEVIAAFGAPLNPKRDRQCPLRAASQQEAVMRSVAGTVQADGAAEGRGTGAAADPLAGGRP